jgi:hypothetical protein
VFGADAEPRVIEVRARSAPQIDAESPLLQLGRAEGPTRKRDNVAEFLPATTAVSAGTPFPVGLFSAVEFAPPGAEHGKDPRRICR